MRSQAWAQLLCLAGTALLVNSFVPVIAQTPPARTYQPGYWQPRARVNPKMPVTVILENQTEMPLKYNFLDDRAEANLIVGDQVQLNKAILPMNIAVYDPSPKAGAGDEVNLTYAVSVRNNILTVLVQPTKEEGYRVVNISRTGAVYLY
ncbi:hypothetical protein IQ230_18180 [Gloeocapsopsis crepidinum LEGE 06123]|uniref:Uncharacterized protein n=1 Tax=Gloeocapsopsis crepidinum LEGE 06123 TaxID=588587 RepID=A0ABR9UYA1_9CHRO|nr:hypothetical protein [Gloeocapsopsis crepidinum]MBE9192248.1 hypothetical protein [Gloeocapsopsis crepidinum LEGE 06123]